MILDGKKLEEIGLAVWGADWKTELGRRIGKSRQTIRRKTKIKTGLPRAWKHALLAALEDQMVTIAAPLNDLRDDIDHR